MPKPQPIERTGRGMSPVQPLALGGIPGDIYHGPVTQSPETEARLAELTAFITQHTVEK